MNPQNLRGNVYNPFPDFLQVNKTDSNRRGFTQIVLDRDNYQVPIKNLTVLTKWETGNKSRMQTNTFHRDDEIVFQLARIPLESVILSPRMVGSTIVVAKCFLLARDNFLALTLHNKSANAHQTIQKML